MEKNKLKYGPKETRAFSMPDLKASDSGDVIEGHAAVFDQPYDMYGMWEETIARGAFDKTDFKDVLFDVNHNLDSLPLARSRNNNANSTLQLQVDDKGLATRAKLDVKSNTDAQALYSAIKRGDITGMSYIFSIDDEEWTDLDTDYPKRKITSIAKVYEVSAVSMPANPGTDISARSQQTLDSAKRMLDSVRARLDSPKNERSQDNVEFERFKAELLANL